MSIQQLLEPDCGGVNPIVQFGTELNRNAAFKDEGFPRISMSDVTRSNQFDEDQLASEFLGQASAPPQTFHMDALLQEMREIESQNFQPQVVNAPRIIDEVTKSTQWINDFYIDNQNEVTSSDNFILGQVWEKADNMVHVRPVEEKVVWVNEFFETDQEENAKDSQHPFVIGAPTARLSDIQFMNYGQGQSKTGEVDQIIDEQNTSLDADIDTWLKDYQSAKVEEVKKTEEYNEKFWQKLQNEWMKLAEDTESGHPWLSEYDDYYDPYKEYNFTEQNPMVEVDDALEKGKAFLVQGDIPSAVLCFEAACRREPENVAAWELLGMSQAENEMDPQAIAALKQCLALQPNNMKVLMALAVSYTNESLQSQAIKMLTTWLHCHPKYKHLVPQNLLQFDKEKTSSLIRGPELKEIQNLFLVAVKQNPNEIDADLQEALGVLFNLSSEYDKAVDCFRAALHVRPDNAKVWNRLGASLANGNRSVEAVEAYQHALEIEPGFIRARYNVGIICMNLKAFKEAAEHLLTALNLQATSSVRSGLLEGASNITQMSDTVWNTLRMVLSLMGRKDLQEHINNRNLDALNAAFNDS